MSAPTTFQQCQDLDSQYQQTMGAYYSMMDAANKFVAAAAILAANPNFSIFNPAFKTWGSNVLAPVNSFIAAQTPPPSPN